MINKKLRRMLGMGTLRRLMKGGVCWGVAELNRVVREGLSEMIVEETPEGGEEGGAMEIWGRDVQTEGTACAKGRAWRILRTGGKLVSPEWGELSEVGRGGTSGLRRPCSCVMLYWD